MDGPIAPKLEDWVLMREFLDGQLRPDTEWSIIDEYPSVIHPQNFGNIRIIKEGDQIVSHAVVKIQILKTPVGIFKLAAIGSVVTHPEHRNKGLSRQIIDSCLELANEQNCDLAILWTDLYDFYRKIGFELGGYEIGLVIDKNITVQASGLRIEKTTQVSPEAISRLYSQHRTGTIRSPLDISRYLKIPNTKLYTAWNSNNQLEAYAVEGKGADLKGYVHEWGGKVSKLLELLSFVRHDYGSPITVITPTQSANFIQQMQDAGAHLHAGYLGMIKILNVENIFAKCQRYARSIGVDDLVIGQDGKHFYLGCGENLFRCDSINNLTQILFGPLNLEEVKGLDEKTKETLGKIFPLPLWVWGWDSV